MRVNEKRANRSSHEIKNPDALLEKFIEAGANWVTVHQEEVVHLNRTLTKIKELGAKAGVAINPSTPISSLAEVISLVDLVLILSVNPGFGGQKFIQSSMRKVQELSDLRFNSSSRFLIEVDGGISKNNIKELANAGCDVFVIGNSIFGQDNITAATIELKNMVI